MASALAYAKSLEGIRNWADYNLSVLEHTTRKWNSHITVSYEEMLVSIERRLGDAFTRIDRSDRETRKVFDALSHRVRRLESRSEQKGHPAYHRGPLLRQPLKALANKIFEHIGIPAFSDMLHPSLHHQILSLNVWSIWPGTITGVRFRYGFKIQSRESCFACFMTWMDLKLKGSTYWGWASKEDITAFPLRRG